MSYNYAGVKSTADTLIKKFGQAVTFYKVARGAYNPASGYSAHTAESYSATIVLFKQPKEEFSEQAVQGKLVKAIASSATEQKIGHTVDVRRSLSDQLLGRLCVCFCLCSCVCVCARSARARACAKRVACMGYLFVCFVCTRVNLCIFRRRSQGGNNN